jgi:C1A family cysteine protease
MQALGRIHAPDERDARFLLSRPREASAIETRYWITGKGTPNDQGSTSQCVAYAWNHWLSASPVRNQQVSHQELYDECQKNDEWPGEDYDGTSVRAGAAALKRRGLISEYRWAFDLETALAHLFAVGPLVVGTDWYMGMFQADKNGFISPGETEVVGGHGWFILGGSRIKKCPDGSVGAARMLNSWGPGWEDKGRAWISFKDLNRLIQADGEICAAIEVRR